MKHHSLTPEQRTIETLCVCALQGLGLLGLRSVSAAHVKLILYVNVLFMRTDYQIIFDDEEEEDYSLCRNRTGEGSHVIAELSVTHMHFKFIRHCDRHTSSTV